MDELYNETAALETEPDFEPACSRHYITADAQGRVTGGWSDGPHPTRDTTGAICINEQGGYQFRLRPGGEENPLLSADGGVPLYKWDGEEVLPRGEKELMEDRMALTPSLLETVRTEKLAQLVCRL